MLKLLILINWELDSEIIGTVYKLNMFHYLQYLFYQDYAYPNCMLQSSYRWDGFNFSKTI